jgi:hypothetical protein
MSARSSDEFDYFNFTRRLGGPPATTSTSREGLAARWRSLRLREDDQRPTDDYFDYSYRLEISRGQASQQRLHQLLVST